MRQIVALALLGVAALFAVPAHADQKDIDAVARGVVRVVIVQSNERGARYLTHGTGFAVSPNQVVTNEHVVRQVARYKDIYAIIVPSDGDDFTGSKIVNIDARRDLALLEISGDLRLPPLTFLTNYSMNEDQVVAMGYPGIIDLASGGTVNDLIRGQTPVTTRGTVSGEREQGGVGVLIHQADIAGGNSGGPLVDECGRLLGVNSSGALSGQGEGGFFFAVHTREILRFLRSNEVDVRATDLPCRSLAEIAAEEDAREDAQREIDEQEAAEAEEVRTSIEADIQEERENYMAAAAIFLLLGAGGLALGWQGRQKDPIPISASVFLAIGAIAILGAGATWIARPGPDEVDNRLTNGSDADLLGDGSDQSALQAGDLICTLDVDRSRTTSNPPRDVEFEWNADGCHETTQYENRGGQWSRIFVPEEDLMVRVATVDLSTGEFRNERYFLNRNDWQTARDARMNYTPPTCGAIDASSRLADMQSSVFSLLPDEPNEKLIYRCENK